MTRGADGSARVRTPRDLGYRMPAEWEPHRATWIAWPESGDWPGKCSSVEWAYADIVRELGRGERVGLLVRSAASEARARAVLTRAAVDLGPVEVHRVATDRTWARDYLPLFVKGGRGRRGTVAAVKWRFNGWARYPDHKRDDAAGIWLSEARGAHAWQPTIVLRGRPTRVVLEGGSVDVDGRGTLLTTDECLLTSRRARHRSLGRDGFERLFYEYLGVDQAIWLERGIAGDDTSGHIDDFARFVAPGRVVVCHEPNRRDPNHAPLVAARRALARARDARGRALDVVPLPMPRPVVYRGARLPASYANFYISNRAVLVPTFNDPADRVALSILADVFRGRDVVPIHCTDLVVGLGTIHCSTQQEPR